MSKKQFWIRLSIYILFGAVIPFAFLSWRFNLFTKVNKISIGGWGLVAIIFVAGFFIALIKAVRKGLPFSLTTQILEGTCKILLPLLIAALCCYYMQDMMKQVFQFLCVLFVCYMVAIPANPIPTWAHENQKEDFQGYLKSLGIGSDKKEKTK